MKAVDRQFKHDVFHKLFGYPKGTLVMIREEARQEFPYMYIYYISEEFKIPTTKFVGVIMGKDPFNPHRYKVKWIADKRDTYLYSWQEVMIKEL